MSLDLGCGHSVTTEFHRGCLSAPAETDSAFQGAWIGNSPKQGLGRAKGGGNAFDLHCCTTTPHPPAKTSTHSAVQRTYSEVYSHTHTHRFGEASETNKKCINKIK